MKKQCVYGEAELKTVQQFQLECLKEIIRVCEKVGVEYFVMGGTSLGAVRHGGFIPWDDDIDVGMTRSNYEKFLKLAPAEFSPRYELQTPYSERAMPYFYSKVRINGTKLVEYCARKLKINHGIYVDVFPFDVVPDDEAACRRQFERVQKLLLELRLRQMPDVSLEPKGVGAVLRAAFRKLPHWYYNLFPLASLHRKLEREMTRYDGQEHQALACLIFPVYKKEYLKKSELYPIGRMKFEDVTVCVPGNIEAYLRTHYGDYHQLPPVEERYGHQKYICEIDLPQPDGGAE